MNRITKLVHEDGQNTLHFALITALKKAKAAIETQKSKGRIRIDPDYFNIGNKNYGKNSIIKASLSTYIIKSIREN